ncbi:MAG: diguanylate cyclase [Candidatus Limnocylindrales bacterium]
MAPSAFQRSTRHLVARWAADPHVLLAIAVVFSALLVGWIAHPDAALPILLPSTTYLLLQLFLASVPGRDRVPLVFDVVRLLIALAAVFWMSLLAGEVGSLPLTSLYLPIVAMAAAMGARQAVVLGTFAVLAYIGPAVTVATLVLPAMQRGAVLVATMIVLAVGTRRTVASLERAVLHVRTASASQRRRNRQFDAVETVGRVLAANGPTAQVLEQVMDVLVDRFGYRYASFYAADGSVLRLGAQRGYALPVLAFDGSLGVIGRAIRTGKPQFVTDVRSDPDYHAADPEIRSEICVPMLVDGRTIGILNVEATAEFPLDSADRETLLVVADRIAAALALADERQALADRAAAFGRLTSFGTAINRSLDVATAHASIVSAVPAVLDADTVVLVLRDPATGDDRIAAMWGGDPRYVGARIPPGEGISGRALTEGRTVVEMKHPRSAFPSTVQGARMADVLTVAASPLLHEDVVIGAVSVTRAELTRPFNPLELETLGLIASQVALAISNAALHAQVADAAIRDPLTGLWNRRHLDTSLARLFALRARLAPEHRRPVAVILFDLDHFGLFNKRHGHITGDAVLRTFGAILSRHLRSSDIVARFGGEEFVAVLDGAAVGEAQQVANDIRGELETTSIRGAGGEPLWATVSAGCAALAPNVVSLEALLEVADVALQMAKRGGRNQVVAA